jgi:hypothetical protein
VVPHPAPCELSSRHKPGSFGACFGAVLGAVLGPARPAGSSSRGPLPDIGCYCGQNESNLGDGALHLFARKQAGSTIRPTTSRSPTSGGQHPPRGGGSGGGSPPRQGGGVLGAAAPQEAPLKSPKVHPHLRCTHIGGPHGRNPNPLRGFSQDLLNLRGPPQNPPWAGLEGDLSN